jgi:Ion channel
MVTADSGAIALDVVGAVVGVVTVSDMFLTIFNYDGFPTLTTFFHRGWWRAVRAVTRPLPARVREVALSIGSAAMLPATVTLWLTLEIAAFALLYDSDLGGSFTLHGASASPGTAFYFSAGAISSESFGDVVPHSGADRTLATLETIIGLATFTLALGYVVTAFDVLGRLESLHGRVRRHASDLTRPESILRRHFRGGAGNNLPSFLQALADDLEHYDQGLRRYPVVYYFHTRRTKRSIPQVFTAVGDLIALLRWGLPTDEPIASDPFLDALHDGYVQTIDRLRRSFVGPSPISSPEPLPRDRFARSYEGGEDADPWVARFLDVQHLAHDAAGRGLERDVEVAYTRYRDWLPFAHRQQVVLDRVADRLGYPEPRSSVGVNGGADR